MGGRIKALSFIFDSREADDRLLFIYPEEGGNEHINW
jgi:hypothetical protein